MADNTEIQHTWLGVTVENQEQADKRIPSLLECQADVRFVSCEPLLGPIDLQYSAFNGADSVSGLEGIDWVIVGGERGPRARPMHISWVRSIRDQCIYADVPFFFKQWEDGTRGRMLDGRTWDGMPERQLKGCGTDGTYVWDEFSWSKKNNGICHRDS